MDIFQTIKQLSDTSGPSGCEEAVGAVAARLLAPYVDEIRTDRLNNVIGVRRCGKPGAKKLLLDAHLDEIGFVVTGVEEGFLRFSTVGGVDARMLPACELKLLTTPPRVGVVTALPPHLQTAGEMEKTIPISDLRIDIGMEHSAAQAAVPVGTRAVYRTECFRLGRDQVCGKALDDRACVAALLYTMELLCAQQLDVDVYVLLSSFEETGGAGATTAAFGIMPDYCIAVDVTHGRTPDAGKADTFPLDKGPTVAVGPNATRWMARRFEEKAKGQDIPYQIEVLPGHSGTNGWELQISREGVATAILSLPLKYMHTPVEVIHLPDLERLSRLLAAFAVNLGEEAPQC